MVSDLGAEIPFDRSDMSTFLFYNLHLDYAVYENFVPFVEFSGQHWTDGGDGGLTVHTTVGDLPLRVVQAAFGTGSGEGNDVVNLGSQGVEGNDIVTMAVGARFPITRHVHAAFSYEFPLTTREDLYQQRIHTNLTYEF